MSWLVTGGAGYIGAHVVDTLVERGEQVVVLDDLSTGVATRVPDGVPFVEGSLLDAELVRRTLRDHDVRGVLHIAAKKQVGESVERPLFYYDQNVHGLIVLLREVADAGVRRFLFSSSSATYGMPDVEQLTEDLPLAPVSPYGETKVVGEWLSRDVAKSGALKAVALRYFNVAGAGRKELGDPAVLNLIQIVFAAITRERRPQIFGDDYPTRDGTAIRDYIHITDLADAHVRALQALDEQAQPFEVYNVGRGEGSTVREVLEVIAEVTGMPVDAEVVGRRAGDPARVVGDVTKIHERLGWAARYDLRDMVASAWEAWQFRPGRVAQ